MNRVKKLSRATQESGRISLVVLLVVSCLFAGVMASTSFAQANPGDSKLLDGNGSDVSNNPKPDGCLFSVSWSNYPANQVIFYRFIDANNNVIFGPTQVTLSAAGTGTGGPHGFTAANLANSPFTNNQGYQMRFETANNNSFTTNVKNKTFFVEEACGANVGITKNSNKTTILQTTEQVVFTMVVTNSAVLPTSNLKVVDTLPVGLTYVSSTPAGCTTSGGGANPTVVSCDIGSLAANGGTATVTITATGSTTGLKTNSASVYIDNNANDPADDSTSNNTATAGVTVTAPPTDGTITVEKIVVGNNADPAQLFAFTDTMPNSSVGSISDNSNVQTYTVTAGTYTITESAPPANWALDTNGLACTDPTTNTTVDQTTRAASINVAVGETVACTWTNRYTEPTGTITIDKAVVGNNASTTQAFGFTDNIPGTVANMSASDPVQSFTVPVGSYTVSENTPPTHWALDTPNGLACVDPSGGTTLNQGTREATIALAQNETVACTWTNRYTEPGTISVDKLVTGTGADQDLDFAFTDDIPGTGVGEEVVDTSHNDAAQTFTLAPGTYNISEDGPLPANWALAAGGLSCIDPSLNTTTNQVTRAAAINLGSGETVTCTWTNEFTRPVTHGTITVEKLVTGTNADPAQLFSFTDDMPDVPTVNNVGSISDNDNLQTFTVPTGTYTITEGALPANWALDTNGLSCVDPTLNSTVDQNTRAATILLSAGETVACTWTNRFTQPTGTITVEKLVTGTNADPAQLFSFTDNMPNPANVGQISDNSNVQSYTVPVGNYTISEDTPPANWALAKNGLSCVDPTNNTQTDETTRSATINLAQNETVACTWTNAFTQPTGTITVEKLVTGTGADVNQLFAFTDDMPGQNVGSIADADNVRTFLVTPGTYNISEDTPPPNWALAAQGLDCIDPTNNSTTDVTTRAAVIDVAQNETVACTWTNEFTQPGGPGPTPPGPTTPAPTPSPSDTPTPTPSDTPTPTPTITPGTLVIEKQTVPDGEADEFSFTGDLPGLPARQVGEAISALLSDNGTASFTVAPGTYNITETEKTGWELLRIECFDSDAAGAASSGDKASATATYNIEEGETARCVFTSVKGEVLGENIPPPEDEVLPAFISKDPKKRGKTLPFTGGPILPMFFGALSLMVMGGALLFSRRRRDLDLYS